MSDQLSNWPTTDQCPREIIVQHCHIQDFISHGPGTDQPWWAVFENPGLKPGDKLVFVLEDHKPKYMSRVIARIITIHVIGGHESLDGWWLIEYAPEDFVSSTRNRLDLRDLTPGEFVDYLRHSAKVDRHRRIDDYMTSASAEYRSLPWWRKIFTRRPKPIDTLQEMLDANPNYPYFLSGHPAKPGRGCDMPNGQTMSNCGQSGKVQQ